MKRLLFLLFALALPMFAQVPQPPPYSGQTYVASQYGKYLLYSYAPNPTTTSSTFFVNGYQAQGPNVPQFVAGLPLLVASGTAQSETITVATVQQCGSGIVNCSAALSCFPGSQICAVSSSFTYIHPRLSTVQSGTFGLQEAINVALGQNGGLVLIDSTWTGSGTGPITAAVGSTSVVIEDVRTGTPQYYQWGGSAYALVSSGGGGGSPASPTGSIQINAGGSTFGPLNLTGLLKQAGTTPGVASGSLGTGAGDYSLPFTINCTGSGLTCSPSGNVLNFTLAGGAGTGSVVSGNTGQIGGYNATGTAIGPVNGLNFINPSWTLAQINTFFAALSCPGQTVIVPDGTPQYPWTNTNCQVKDMRKGADYLAIARYGIACDATHYYLTTTAGNSTIGIGSYPINVGMTFAIGQQTTLAYGMIQNAWEPTVVSITGGNTANLSGPAPFSFSGFMTVGTDNTASLGRAFADAGQVFPLRIPAGCFMLTGAVQWSGTSIIGQQTQGSGFVGMPGQSVIVQPQAGGAGTNGLRLSNFNINVDSTINSKFGYRQYPANGGAYTAVAPSYIPILNHSQDANNPLADQWVLGGNNGVASTTASSNVICVANALNRLPPTAQTIVFPYFPVLFTTTVLSSGGQGSCATNFTQVTLNASLPSGGAYTVAQAYYETGTAFETLMTTIPTTITYPLTITVSLPNAPDSKGESGAAPWGHVIIGNNTTRLEADYLGNNYNATAGSGTFILRKGPATIGSSLTSGNAVIVPANYCPAKYTVPWPVVPNLNTNDTTPSGAVYFPGECVGEAAILFPQADGHAAASTGMSASSLGPLSFSVTGLQGTNGTAAMVQQGNTAGYSTTLDQFKVEYLEFGIVQGPASVNNWGVAAVGPTGAGNKISNCQLRVGIGLVLTDFQQGSVDRCDTYLAFVSDYDGTQAATGTGFYGGYTLNEQTGGVVTNCAVFSMRDYNAEPEGGSQVVPVYFESDCVGGDFSNVQLEGPFSIFGGIAQLFENSQISLPSINYGSNNRWTNLTGSNAGYYSNVWGGSEFYNWGVNSSCGWFAGGQGPPVNCFVGGNQPFEGHSALSSAQGTTQFENELGSEIVPGEWGTYGYTNLIPYTVDPTAPKWGSYAACNLGGSAQCNVGNFDGFNGGVYIGLHNRIAPIPYVLEANLKNASAGSTITMYVAAFVGTGSESVCTNPGIITNVSLTVTNTWAPYSVPVDFTGRQGCQLTVQFYNATTTDQLRIDKFDFVPLPTWINSPVPADSIQGTACPVAGRIYGTSSTGYFYQCVGTSGSTGTIKRIGPAS